MADLFELPEADGWLDFEEGPWKGARVRTRLTVPIDFYLEIMESINTSRKPAELRATLRKWADAVLLEWNVVRKGKRLPATADGFVQLPVQGATMMVRAWLNAVPDVELPLGPGSPAGDTSGD